MSILKWVKQKFPIYKFIWCGNNVIFKNVVFILITLNRRSKGILINIDRWVSWTQTANQTNKEIIKIN